MCDASQLAMLSLGGTGLKAGTQAMQARYTASALRQNEIMAQRAALRTREAGAAQASELRQRGRSLAGQQQVALSANGAAASTSRSAMDLLSDTAYLSDLDARTAIDNAGQQADALELAAQSKKAEREALRIGAPLAVGTGLLTGGARAYGIYKKATL